MSIRRFSSDNDENLPSNVHQRPLSLYDNLNAVTQTTKTTSPTKKNHQNKFLSNDESINSNNSLSSLETKNNDYLKKVNQNDFVFSDIKFKFPELNQRKLLINNNHKNSSSNNNINEGYLQTPRIQIPTTNNSEKNCIPENNHQYVNIDETFNKSSVISDAKSKFFSTNMINVSSSNINIKNDDDDDDIDHNIEQIINNNNNNNNNCEKNNDVSENLLNENDLNKNNQNDLQTNKMVTYNDTDMDNLMEPKPSQAVYMATTVPQNIKGNNIMGRHTPTRNSLRHSRMLVINKSFQGTVIDKRNPLQLKCPIFSKVLLIFQIIVGVLLTSLGIWILLWAPNTRNKDNPLTSGILLLLSGTIGIILMEFKRSTRNRLREKCFIIHSIIITVFSGIIVLVTLVFGAIHLMNLASADKDCHPATLFTSGSACVCIFKTHFDHVRIEDTEKLELPLGAYEFEYRDLSCSEVVGAWQYLLITSVAFNSFAFIIVLVYLILFCFNRTKRKYYKNVRSNPPV